MSINGNKKKDTQLGMAHGTASNRLRKMLLFKYVVSCGDNKCFQCGKVIDNIENFSIEHKVAWLNTENPVKLFFDLDNVSFSHLSCNIASGTKMEKQPINHGTQSGYKKGCRCHACYDAQVAHNKRRITIDGKVSYLPSNEA